jgi:peptidoglycan/LPS O-acetylase OafA/YrhL
MMRMFDLDELLTPVHTRVRLVTAVVCAAIALVFSALFFWFLGAMTRPGVAKSFAALIFGVGLAAIAVIFGIVAFRLARRRRNRPASSVSRWLFVSAAFFGLLAIFSAVSQVAMRDTDHLDAVIGSSLLALLSYGCAENAKKPGQKNGAT